MCEGEGDKSFSSDIHEGRGLMKMSKPKSPVPITLGYFFFFVSFFFLFYHRSAPKPTITVHFRMDLILPSCVGSPEAGADAIPYSVENYLYQILCKRYSSNPVIFFIPMALITHIGCLKQTRIKFLNSVFPVSRT